MKVRVIKGTKQIGGCITEISTDKTKILIDFGEDLDDSKEAFELEGLTYGKPSYDAVFITHSHGDHIGLINNIDEKIPVYVEEKSLEIHNITSDFCGGELVRRKINTFKLVNGNIAGDVKIKLQDIVVIPYRNDHSSYNSCMYLIECDGKKILHTGDYRMHGRKGSEFLNILKKIGKVDILITEGTCLNRSDDECESEVELEKKVLEIMKEYDQVFVMQSSTNIDRTVSFVRSAIKSGKNVILDLFTYALSKVIRLNIRVDFKRVFVWIPSRYYWKENNFKEKYMNFETRSYFGRKYMMQVKASMLEDIRRLYDKGLVTKVCLVYSMWDGYIEKEVKLKKFIDTLENEMKIKFIPLHTSGHADKESMKKLNDIVNPDKTIIIHTEDSESGQVIFNNVINIDDLEYVDL